MIRLRYRVRVTPRASRYWIYCPGCDLAVLWPGPPFWVARRHAEVCPKLRRLNSRYLHACVNCAQLPVDERRDCVVCLGRGWLPNTTDTTNTKESR
ncbi:hypothetical protein [Tessaracoccus palaemonis]|uniref:Uncharacterized protein n=1 Tax=Tessaracoccus palaemonis TaxID=2829499 RepID=A0ABX8SH75_9ACTN|nr:hypothetical protein [Tessaracoccus palaemonis]QXT62731.1 hypothetical protein KDB89_13510 [Tessaracoccus palaemonis]